MVLDFSARHAVLLLAFLFGFFFVSFFFLDLNQRRAFHSVLLRSGAGSEDSFWTWFSDPSLLVVILTNTELGSCEPQTKVPTVRHGMSHVLQAHLFPALLGARRWLGIGLI